MTSRKCNMHYSVKNDRLVIEIKLHSENDIYDWFLQTDFPVKLSDIERLKTEYKNQKSKPMIRDIDFEKPDEKVLTKTKSYNDVYHWLVSRGYSPGIDTEQLSIILEKFFDAKENAVIDTDQLYRIMTIFDAFGLDKNIKLINVVPNSDIGSIKIIKSFPALKDIKPAEFDDNNDDLFCDDPSIRSDPNGISNVLTEQEDTAS